MEEVDQKKYVKGNKAEKTKFKRNSKNQAKADGQGID